MARKKYQADLRLIGTPVAGDVPYGTGAQELTRLAIGAATTVLHGGASAPTFSQVAAADVSFAFASLTASQVTLAQGAELTKTTPYLKYLVLGKLCILTGALAITSAGTANNPIVLTVPVSAPNLTAAHAGAAHQAACGSFGYIDSGVGYYSGAVIRSSTTTFTFILSSTTALAAVPDGFGTTTGGGLTAANNDNLWFTFMYELA